MNATGPHRTNSPPPETLPPHTSVNTVNEVNTVRFQGNSAPEK